MLSIPQSKDADYQNGLENNPSFYGSQETYLILQDRNCLQVNGWKSIFQANGTRKQAATALLISD